MKKAKNTASSVSESPEGESRRLSEADRNRIRKALTKHSIRDQALLDEIVFILRQRLLETGVKIHDIEGRVKRIESVLEKCERKGFRITIHWLM
jgi:(p)ppGpp synthase/HD superfamily hydrolase